ncbi:MAG: hypothetical protein KGP14_15525, partial [Betaproteobacteria bacterium]|nr:hypothetical protein [Betaproteobacteria bacterium]
ENPFYAALQINGEVEYIYSETNETFLHKGPGAIILLNELLMFFDECCNFQTQWITLRAMFCPIAVGKFFGDKFCIFVTIPQSDIDRPIDIMTREQFLLERSNVRKIIEKFGKLPLETQK